MELRWITVWDLMAINQLQTIPAFLVHVVDFFDIMEKEKNPH
jgi:hypothetical protein